jgi:hypothetical protein
MVFVGILTPDLNVLPESQRRLWSRLASTPSHFVLYGGTGLALRLGHRESIDFDFFSCRPFQPLELVRSIPYLENQVITQQAENTLSCDIDTGEGFVHISFFGGLSIGQIETPDQVEDTNVAVASFRDLFGMKCATVPQRNETKDYVDIHALISRTRIDLSEGLACAGAIYGRQYNPLLTLQALSYFDDLREPLAPEVKSDLLAAVKAVSLQNLPTISASHKIGDGVQTA